MKPIFAEHGFPDIQFGRGSSGRSNDVTYREDISTTISRKGNNLLIKKLQALGWSVRYEKPMALNQHDRQYVGYSMLAILKSPNLLERIEDNGKYPHKD